MPLKNLVLCDIQPYLASYFHVPSFMEYIKRAQNILCIYDQSLDFDEFDVQSFYYNWLPQTSFERIDFVAKEYGFFRDFIDHGFDDDEILSLLEFMKHKRITSIYNITDIDEIYKTFDEHFAYWITNTSICFYIPDFEFCKDSMRRYEPFRLIGGHKDLCLRELRLLFDFWGLRYSVNDQFIYG